MGPSILSRRPASATAPTPPRPDRSDREEQATVPDDAPSETTEPAESAAPEEATTVAFLTLAMAQLWHVFTMRNPGSGWIRNEITENPWVWGALGLCIVLLLLAVGFPVALIFAWVYEITPTGLQKAADVDRRRKNGEPVGRLGGLPVAVKDVLCTERMLTTCGSRMLENFVAPYDATVVARLRQAGVVTLGKTNLPELGTTPSAP